MKKEQFQNKRYLINASGERVAHVHTFGNNFKVCGHITADEYAKKKFEFNEEEFNQFLSDNNLVMEG